MAKLYFRYGAMNSGKSTALIQVAHNYEERGMSVLLVKPAIDTKGADTVVSRIGASRTVDLLATPDVDLYEAVKAANAEKPISCVLADEAQFFTPQQVDQLFLTAVTQGIPVICYGLRSDFQMNGFPGSTRLLEIAHSIEELKTICTCGKKALINARMVNGEFVFEGAQVAIDGEASVEYRSVCPQCYFRLKAEAEAKK
ncbi:MAG: thymidine kinase [Oscillospiraceae bacterium]|nr:thymidine kinase [Oscillospiraceae bacterium]